MLATDLGQSAVDVGCIPRFLIARPLQPQYTRIIGAHENLGALKGQLHATAAEPVFVKGLPSFRRILGTQKLPGKTAFSFIANRASGQAGPQKGARPVILDGKYADIFS